MPGPSCRAAAPVTPPATPPAAPAAPFHALLAVLAFGVGIGGCDLDSNFSDLGEKLLDPDVQGFDTPGQRLLTGAYFDLNILQDEVGARYAMARSEAGELAIVDFAAKTQCRVPDVARYGNAISAEDQPAVVPLILVQGSGEPQLGFTGFDCQQLPFQLPTASLPLDVINGLPEGSGTSLLIRTPDAGLALVDPWEGSSRRLANTVRSGDPLSAFGHYLWVDGGSIVISDAALTPVEKFGEGISEFTLSTSGAELAYVEPTAADGAGTLLVVDALGSKEPMAVAEDACNLRYLSIERRLHLAYFSPCAERRLVLLDREDGSSLVIADGVAGAPVLQNINRQTLLTYVTTSSDSTPTGTLWMRALDPDATPVAIAENARANLSTVTPDGGGLLTMLDWSNTGGRLVEWRGDALTDIADRVVEIAPLGSIDGDLTLLGNFDGVTGDLLRLQRNLSLEVLASGVPTRSASDDAFLANFDGNQGDLRLLNRADGSSQLLGTGVARGSFKLAQQFRGVMMLTNRDPETNTSDFEVHLLDSGEDFRLNTGVTEAREVAFPSPGFLYNVVQGETQGVYFSKTL
jgi:hypothetical protein